MRMFGARTVSLFVGAWLSGALVHAGTIFVNASATGANNGSSWANAYTTLPLALSAAASGSEIWVAAATYKPTATTDRTVSFVLKNGVGVYGGFAGTETLRTQRDPAAHVTILSGDIGVAADFSDNSYHVVTSDSTVTVTGVLDGFTVTGGNANGDPGSSQDRGGGMWVNMGSPTIAHCVFTGNAAAERGGGIRTTTASPVIDGCVFTSNSGATGGGGVCAGTGSSFTVRNSVFRGNSTVSTAGGGLEATAGVTAVNCVFQGNSGNGVYFFQDGAVADSTVTGSESYGVALIESGTIVNSILWGDSIDEIFIGSGTISVSYSDVGGSGFGGPGNKNADPLFRNPGANDLRLGTGSPAVDAGSNSSVPGGTTTDIAGLPRFFDDPAVADTGAGTAPIVDMGAYERVPLTVTAPSPASQTVCAGSSVVYSVTASGNGPFTYHWRRNTVNLSNGSEISGATTSSLTINPAGTGDTGSYDVVVTDSLGQAVTSAAAALTVTAAPAAPTAGNDGPICAGQTLHLTASPTVANATYAWTGPNGFLSSQQNPMIVGATTAASGIYSVTVTPMGTACAASSAGTTTVSVTSCSAQPIALSVDGAGNGVLEPGETVAIAPSWKNATGSSFTLTGAATAWTGPVGATYAITDAAASYGTLAAGATASCTVTSNCYGVSISNPATRPAFHWDATFSESLSSGDTKAWTVHVGKSFADVPVTVGFYRFVETLLHKGVTAGCGGGNYCPGANVTRGQMAVFLLVSKEGAGYTPPACTTAVFADVPCSSGLAPWIDELAARGVTAGCGGGNYCPTANVTRAQMAVFLLTTLQGPAYTPPACVTPTFPDVPCSSGFAKWVDELALRGITAGCGGGLYCPNSPNTRGQMAVFLSTTFGLTLYGP